ncbi:MAG: hypothetical protein IPM24_05615 [Bryobacterales bacterium]|nr:hypothetical protein [Bryobacterales bacterium]
MIQGLDRSSREFLQDLSRLKTRSEQAMRRISSGYRVTRPSDDPASLSRIQTVQASLERATQVLANLNLIRTEVNTAEHALGQAVQVMDRVIELGARGATSTATAESRAAAAIEVEGLLGRLVNLANTQINGRYLFAGDADQAQPFALDLAAPEGVTAYAGAAATRQMEDVHGVRFSVARDGGVIFHVGAASAFAAVNALRVALETNDEAAIQANMGALRSAGDHLNQHLAFYGFAQNRVSDATEGANQAGLVLRETLAALRDADIVEAAVTLSQTRTHEEAAYSARARLPRSSLFDFLG